MTETKLVPVEPTREMQLAMQRALVASARRAIAGEVCTNARLETVIYAAALSAAPSPQVGREGGDGWQDISTAPAWPTTVLIATAVGEVGEAYCQSNNNEDDGWWWVNTHWGDYPTPDRPETPTHWRPLPQPPSLINGGE